VLTLVGDFLRVRGSCRANLSANREVGSSGTFLVGKFAGWESGKWMLAIDFSGGQCSCTAEKSFELNIAPRT